MLRVDEVDSKAFLTKLFEAMYTVFLDCYTRFI